MMYRAGNDLATGAPNYSAPEHHNTMYYTEQENVADYSKNKINAK